ncbi:rhodanese-like domain-containing protein [Tabrizicola oligotrophica]|uniref:Rhodanese-like domain-containing protein n=1 Tax=Tabrizicola oligotrophica TaxID=2710650 RepID=A0A6M0QTD3_9RHOB|nr:rhodanese-like domain-containing protein [Tabrizicola oligotrophica]NEY90725.1 rhodanese-like domain-containing protein [Tabrizicola oligotrophica]
MLTRRFLISSLALLPLAATAQAGAYEAQPLSVAEMQAGGGLIVDIRTPEEWAETGVIAGARLVTFEGAQGFIAAVGPDLADGRDLILVCRSGRRSAAAAEALQTMIPNRIISVEGGMARLIDAGYRTVQPQ